MDIWNGVKKTLGVVAPVLANAIVPGSGGLAASLVSSVLGVENTPEAINEAIKSATPEQLVSLKKIENDHKERLVELAIENDKIYLNDRQNARNREMEIVKSTGKTDKNLYTLAWTVVIGYFLLCTALMYVPLPQGSNQVVFMLFGALSSGFGMVLQYFFGSSKSSSDKTQHMAAMINKNETTKIN